MFDSLKDKFGRFREDVEETAEEKASEAEAGENVAESEAEEKASEVKAEETTEPVDDADRDAEAADAAESEPDEEHREREYGEKGLNEEGSAGFVKTASSFARGRIVIEEQDIEDPLWELEMALLESDVEMSVTQQILTELREQLVGSTRKFSKETPEVVEEALAEALHSVISVGQFDFDERVAEADKPLVVIFTGVNGVGKTTSIAKLVRYFDAQGYSSVIANGDTYRAGANEQIREHADELGVKLISHEQGGDPAAVIYDAVEYAEAHDVDVVLGDTAGRLHTSEGLMDQLAKIDRVVDPGMTLFVDEAVAGQDAVNRAREFDEAAAFDGAILTKADADSNGGAAISIAHVTGKPILFLGTGQGYDDLERFDPDRMVARLLGEDEAN